MKLNNEISLKTKELLRGEHFKCCKNTYSKIHQNLHSFQNFEIFIKEILSKFKNLIHLDLNMFPVLDWVHV